MEQITKYFPDLSQTQLTQLGALQALYASWNDKINVISRKDIDNLYEHHVLHSLAIAKVISFTSGSNVLDVGTGGGFPGVPLAILFPQTHFTLVDSVGKKLHVIDAIAEELGLKNIKTIHDRVENIEGTYDFILSRAVSRLDVMWAWVYKKIATDQKNTLPNGLLYLKGGDITAETPHAVDVKRWELKDMFTEDYFSQKSLVLLTPITHNKL
jgi:16S rRNA (guanine527-N7)-methyltransferase